MDLDKKAGSDVKIPSDHLFVPDRLLESGDIGKNRRAGTDRGAFADDGPLHFPIGVCLGVRNP